MDAALLKTMLDSQERGFKSALEIVVKQMNDQIHHLENKVSDLTTSLEFTQREVDDLKAKNKEYEKEKSDAKIIIDKLTQQVNTSNIKIKELEDRTNYQEDYSRRNNVRISGVQENELNENWERTAMTVTSLLEQKLQLPGIVLERAHRVGIRRDANRPRPIVAKFARYADRDAVMRNAKKLKGTNIYINEDLCAASQAVKNAQMPLLKEARAQGKVAFFRHTKLIIKERTEEGASSGYKTQQMSSTTAGAVGLESAGGAGDVTVEVAGAWAGTKDTTFPSLPTPRHTDSSTRLSLPSTSASASTSVSASTATQNSQTKKYPRRNVKK